ncbi:MAG: LysR substrate-binding domain-containing protein [Gammaproteobacteria bacterium]
MENFTDIAVFCRVVDTGSFTKAAEQLGLSRAVASKSVSRLEARLGARLLNRTTRRLSLTEAGATLYEGSHSALGRIEEAEIEIAQLQTEPRGMLKVSVPMTFGILHIAPALPAFLEGHPGITLEMRMDDRIVDLVDEGFDLAIRISSLADSTLVARRLAPCRFAVCGSQAYFDRRGVPQTPDDLRAHNCIIYVYQPSPNVWRFSSPDDDKEISMPVRGNLRVNNGIAQRDAALQGLGITVSPTFIVGELFSEGLLLPVLTDYSPPEVSVYAVYPQRKYLSPKVRAFIEFFAARFGPEPYWDRF